MAFIQAVFASKVEKTNGDLTVTREVDGGLETIKVRRVVLLGSVKCCGSLTFWYGSGS
jgi:hypothetical protein